MVTVYRSYMRRRDAARPSYTQSPPVANGAQVYLDSSASGACWVIEHGGRPLYRMLPNPADPEYSSFPNFDGCWDVAGGVLGVPLWSAVFSASDCDDISAQVTLRPRLTCRTFPNFLQR